VPFRFRKSSVVHQVTVALRREIEAGSVAGWLPTERALGKELHVSRRTLRLELEQLKRDGLVSARVGVGTRILPRPATRSRPSGTGARSVGLLMPEPIGVRKGVRKGVMPGIRKTQDGFETTHDALNGVLKNVLSGFLA